MKRDGNYGPSPTSMALDSVDGHDSTSIRALGKNDNPWTTVGNMILSSGDALQAVYEEVMKFLMTPPSDHYEFNDDDRQCLLESSAQIFSNKSLKLRDSKELSDTMVEISASSNSAYRSMAWEFLSGFLQYSNDMVVPTEFLRFNIYRFCHEKSEISYNILKKTNCGAERPWQELFEFVIDLLLKNGTNDTNHQWIFEKFVEILKERPVSQKPFLKKALVIIKKSTDRQHLDDAFAFLDKLTDCQALILKGHTNSVISVAYSPDGTRIASGSYDNGLRLWDALTGAQIGHPFIGHAGSINHVSFSPDSKYIVSGSSDNTLRIWDSTGKQIGRNLEGHQKMIRSVKFSPDGKRIVSCSHDKTLRIWDAQTGLQLGQSLIGHTHDVLSVAFSRDGKTIVLGSLDNTIRIWDAEQGRQLNRPPIVHQSMIRAVAFSPDGIHIISGSDDKTIRLWDSQTGEQVGKPLVGHTDIVSSVAFFPDGKRIVSGSSDNTVRIWNVSTGKQIGQSLQGHSDAILSTTCSPDGTQVVSGSRDNTIRIWDISLKLWDITD